MRRFLLLVLTAGLVLSCSNEEIPSSPQRPDVAGAISDGSSETVVGDPGSTDPDLAMVNRHFFWLAPMVPEPDHSLFGTFDPDAMPIVRIVCWEDSEGATCDRDLALATFTVGNGLIVESDHYNAEFDTRAPDPILRTSNGDGFTTYRIEARTSPLGQFGGPYVFGFADFQLGENGEIRNIHDPEMGMIGLKDGRVLPIRFRLDEGALEQELADNLVTTGDPSDPDDACQINCSFTFIDPNEPTEASLFDLDTGLEITALHIPASSLIRQDPTVPVFLLIDELVDDGDAQDGVSCLTRGELLTEACFRYELSQDNEGDDFQAIDGQLPRYGICPEGEAVVGGAILPTWRLLKADLEQTGENGTDDIVVTRPEEVDVSDFLQCDVQTTPTTVLWDGPGGQLAGSFLGWLVPPVEASDFVGGQLRRLSDGFWGLDLAASVVSTPPTSAGVSTVVLPIVQFDFAHTGDAADGIDVMATVTQGDGALLDPTDETSGTSLTFVTDADGRVAVNFQLGATAGTNEVTLTSDPPALGTPIVFEVEGVAGQLELTDVDPASTTLVINGNGVAYTATIVNNTGAVETGVLLQAWVEQGATRRAAGGVVVSCGGQNVGDVPPGTCSESFTYSASDQPTRAGTGTFTPGAATAVFELQVNGVVVDEVRIPVTLLSADE